MRFRAPVVQFALSGLLATLLIGLVAVAVLRRIGNAEAIRSAKQVTRLAGEGIVAPNLTPGVLAGDPAALRRLDRVVRARVLRDGVVRVKLWTPDGRIVYSDEPRLIGARYPPDEPLEAGRVESSDLERRRIAADLHDGPVQDLVGVAYELAAQAGRVGDEDAAAALHGGAARARDSVRALRALLPEIYPPSLHDAELAAALED